MPSEPYMLPYIAPGAIYHLDSWKDGETTPLQTSKNALANNEQEIQDQSRLIQEQIDDVLFRLGVQIRETLRKSFRVLLDVPTTSEDAKSATRSTAQLAALTEFASGFVQTCIALDREDVWVTKNVGDIASNLGVLCQVIAAKPEVIKRLSEDRTKSITEKLVSLHQVISKFSVLTTIYDDLHKLDTGVNNMQLSKEEMLRLSTALPREKDVFVCPTAKQTIEEILRLCQDPKSP